MKPRRGHIKLTLFLLFLGALAVGYYHFGFFPGKLRDVAIETIEDYTGKKVLFRKTVYIPFQGLTFYDLSVRDKKNNLIFSANKLAINADIMAFINENKIIITNLFLDTPLYTHILDVRQEEPVKKSSPAPLTQISGQIQVPVVPARKNITTQDLADNPEALLPDNVYIQQIEIINAEVTVKKNASDNRPLEKIVAPRLKLNFSKPPILQLDGNLRIGTSSITSISFQGLWNLDKTLYTFNIQAQARSIPWWVASLQKNHLITLQQASVIFNAKLRSNQERLSLFEAQLELSGAHISMQDKSFSGNMFLDASGVVNFENKKITQYKGTLDFVDVRAENISKQIKQVRNLSGKIDFEPDLISIGAMRGEYRDIEFLASGRIESFRDLNIKAELSVESDIDKLLKALPSQIKNFTDRYQIRGQCQTKTKISGSLKQADSLKLAHRVFLDNASAHDTQGKFAVDNLSVYISSDSKGFELEHGHCVWEKQAYEFNAIIPLSATELGNLSLSSETLRLNTTFNASKDRVQLKNATVDYYGIHSLINEGLIVNFSAPHANFKGRLYTELATLKQLPQDAFKWLKLHKIEGYVQGPFTAAGNFSDPMNWDVRFDANCENFIYDKLSLSKLDLQFRFKNRQLDIPYIRTNAYDGVFGGKAFFDFGTKSPEFDTELYANEIELKKLLSDLNGKTSETSGRLVFQMGLRGVLNDQQSYTGSAIFNIQNGHIWKTDLFKQMGKLPFVRVEGLDEVVFTDATANFTIEKKRLHTDNLHLKSEVVDLNLTGSIGFDQTLDMIMEIHYSENVLEGAFDAGGIAPLVVSKVDQIISNYKISGTLGKPKSEKILTVNNPLKTAASIAGDII